MNLRELRLQEMAASVDNYRALLVQKQHEADLARQQVLRIGRVLCGEAMQQLAREGLDQTLALESLATLILAQAQPGPRLRPDQDTGQLRLALEAQTRRALQAEEALAASEQRRVALEHQLAARRTEPVAAPPLESPAFLAWYEEWPEGPRREQARQVVLCMGATGYARRSELVRELEKTAGWKPRSAYLALSRCEAEGLLVAEKGSTATGGRPTDRLTLTPLGEWLYARLAARPPATNEYAALLREHKSDRHIALIYAVGDCFQALGFDVQREPQHLALPENRSYQPDLVLTRATETYYLEVETGERADRPSLARKWENACLAGGGRICVVTARPGPMTTLQSQINAWAIQARRRVTLYLSNLEHLRKIEPEGSPWVRIRQAPSA